jgi:hypothetical protein
MALFILGIWVFDLQYKIFFFLGCSEKFALQALKASDWNLEGAFDLFYSQPQIRSIPDSRHLEELYQRYKGT